MHLFKNTFVKNVYAQHAPDIWENVKKATSQSHNNVPDIDIYDQSRAEPYETAIMEHAECVAVVPCDPKWSDVGSWESLWEINEKDSHGNSTEGEVYCEETNNSMIVAKDRIVTCLGMNDVIVIETEDTVLVANKQCGNSLKKVVGELKKNARKETVEHDSNEHTWGKQCTILKSKKALITEYRLLSDKSFSIPSLNQGSELYIAEGNVIVKNNGAFVKVTEGEVVNLKALEKYEIINTGLQKAKIYQIINSADTQKHTFKVRNNSANDLIHINETKDMYNENLLSNGSAT
jgi:hypothetical protein